MTRLPYALDEDPEGIRPMGLIVLQTDESIEADFAATFRDHASPLFVTRIPSAPEVSRDTLAAMEGSIKTAAALLPRSRPFGVVGYGCTSASSVIGSRTVGDLVRSTCDTAHVTNPLSAALACFAHRGVSRIALVSPYVEDVNTPLRAAFEAGGVATPVFGTFEEAVEANVARISPRSIADAAISLGSDTSVDAVFLSCTNLRTLDIIPHIAATIGKPVFSSNQALAWHMAHLDAGHD